MNCQSHVSFVASHKHTTSICRYSSSKSGGSISSHLGDIDDVQTIEDMWAPEEHFEMTAQLSKGINGSKADLCYAPNINELSMMTSSMLGQLQVPHNKYENQYSQINPLAHFNALNSHHQEPHLELLKVSNNLAFSQSNNANQQIKRENFHLKRLANKSIQRTGIVGALDLGSKEFDDYFEIHIDKFFTPELHELTFYHDNKSVYGLQLVYRDAWGTLGMEKETYKGKLHLSNKISPASCLKSTLTLEYDEYLKQLYVDGQEQITYIKLVTSENRVLELGSSNRKNLLVNFIAPLTRIIGVGGSLDVYLNALYFYSS